MRKIMTAVLVLLVFSTIAFADSGDYYNGGMMGMVGYNFLGLGWLGMIIMALFWIIIIAAVFYLFYWLLRQGVEKEDAHEILKKRYARGEISEKEFRKMKKEL